MHLIYSYANVAQQWYEIAFRSVKICIIFFNGIEIQFTLKFTITVYLKT